VRQYRFRALVTFDLPAGGHLGGPRACCLVQPGHGKCFPAGISWDRELPVRPGAHVVLSVALDNGEAEAFFAPGQRFTIWADAVIGHTIRADGLAGSGVISGQVPLRLSAIAKRGHPRPHPGSVLAARPCRDGLHTTEFLGSAGAPKR
jgi:hypothetical protein